MPGPSLSYNIPPTNENAMGFDKPGGSMGFEKPTNKALNIVPMPDNEQPPPPYSSFPPDIADTNKQVH